MTDDVCRTNSQRIERAEYHTRLRGGGVQRPGRAAGATIPQQIDCQHPVACCRQRAPLLAPTVGPRGKAVDQHHRRAIAWPFVCDVDAVCADRHNLLNARQLFGAQRLAQRGKIADHVATAAGA